MLLKKGEKDNKNLSKDTIVHWAFYQADILRNSELTTVLHLMRS